MIPSCSSVGVRRACAFSKSANRRGAKSAKRAKRVAKGLLALPHIGTLVHTRRARGWSRSWCSAAPTGGSRARSALPAPYATDSMQLGSLLEGLESWAASHRLATQLTKASPRPTLG
jgi:hypothetical protein